MNTNATQKQLKISLSHQLNKLLQAKAERLGIPVTQFVKHIIIQEVEEKSYPTFAASKRTQSKAQKAINELNKTNVVESVTNYLNNL